MARAVTGEDVPARIEREPLLTPWVKGGSLEEIDLAILHVAAISETLACALMTVGLEGVTDATSKAFLANLAADEIHHARRTSGGCAPVVRPVAPPEAEGAVSEP